MQIAIVEDEKAYRNILLLYLRQFQQENGIKVEIKEFENGNQIIWDYKPYYDVIFMDIEMQGMNGLEVARYIRKVDEQVLIVFSTNAVRYAVQGYEVGALDFIVKPITYTSFKMKMQKIVRQMERNWETSITLMKNDEMYKIPSTGVYYIEVSNHQLIYHTDQGDITVWKSLKSVEVSLENMHFAKCNRCYLVNLLHVQSIKKDTVLVGRDELKISRGRRIEFIKAVAAYKGKFRR